MKNDFIVSSHSFTTPQIIETTKQINPTNYDASSTFFEPSTYSEVISQKESLLFDVAKWFLYKESMSNKKLQKICYYAYAWFTVFFNDMEASSPLKTLCPQGFQAWVHGPVSPELYNTYRVYGWNNIPSPEICPVFSEDLTDLLEQVWNTYGHFSADELERLTHNETPWKAARNGKSADEASTSIIDARLVFQYYSKMMG